MLTLSRVGQTPLFAETTADPASHGGIGFLVPDNTPHIPAQLTIADVWNWGINSRGAGWCLFSAPGQPIPKDQAGATALIRELRKRLPSSATKANVGFVWLDGNLSQPATLVVQRLDVLAANPARGQPNPITPAYEQTFTFKQFTIAIAGGTEIRVKSDYSGFEIQKQTRKTAVEMRIPVAPQRYASATTALVPFAGEFRGAMQFTLEPLTADKFGYGAIDASLYYYLRPASGSGNPRVLRYPIIDEPRLAGALNFEATFFPTYQQSSFFRVQPQGNQPTPVPSYFRTTAGFPVDLLANVAAKGRFYLRPRPNFNREVTDLPEIYYLAPGGGFEVAAGGPLDDNSMIALLAGASGTEYLRLRPRNGTAGDLLKFDLDRNAYAQTFGDLGVGGSALLTPDYKTSWATVQGVGSPSTRYYYAQPPDAPLYQANGIFEGTQYLDFSENSIATIETAFPMTPLAGVNIEPYANTVDVNTYETFERDVMIPTRDETIKRASAAPAASPARSMRKLLATGATTEKRTTPQGLVVDVNIADNRYTRLLLGSLAGTELAIDEPTVTLQQALASPKVFLVISHLENVGTFDSNSVSLSSWNFVADVATASTDAVRSIMVMKFADGTSIANFLTDTTRWTDPDAFTSSSATMATRLQGIVADLRSTANNASTDPDIKKYVTAFLRDVIDEPNWAGTLVFDVSLGDPNEMPREIRGLLPGMVITKPGTAGYDGNSYTVPTNKVDPSFKAHHLRVDIAKVDQDASTGEILGVHNSSMFAMINYVNQNGEVNGVTRWKNSTTTEVAPIGEVNDFGYRVKFMRVAFENSYVGSFTSDVTIRFYKLFKELPDAGKVIDGKTSVNSITLSGLLQQIDGIPTYVFRFGCVDPLKNNFIVCKEAGLDGLSALIKFPDSSPVITWIESTRVDYNMLQISMDVGGSNIAEFVMAGYLSTRELDGRDFFSYKKIGFGKLSLVMNYNSVDPATATDDPAKPEEMGNPFWIFTPNTMKFDSVRGETRSGSVVNQAPLTLKGIAESVSTFSAADAGVFPIPNLVPMAKAMIPYQPANTAHIAEPSPITYIISYGVSTAGIGLDISTGGLIDITIHTGWKEGTWAASGENVFYTALQWGTPLTSLDIGKRGMFKIGITDFGFGEVPMSTTDRLYFVYINGLTITVLKWTATASLMLFAPAPADRGFGALGEPSNITSWFASFQLNRGSSGTSGIKFESLTRPIPAPATTGDPVIELASTAMDMVILERDSKNVPKKFALSVAGWLQNTGGISAGATVTVTARLYENGEITSSTAKTTTATFPAGDLNGAKSYLITFDTEDWPTSDTTYAADVRVTGSNASDKRAKTIRQTNTVSLRADEGRPGRSGSPIVAIDYLAVGRGIRLRRGSAADGDSNLNVRPEVRTVGDALQLMRQMLPAGESGPDLYNVLRDIYAPSAGMMVGIDITIMGWLRFAIIADTADEIYGGLIEIKNADKLPSFAQKFAGLRIEILYRRLWDDSDLGVYEGTLVLPEALRSLDVGGFSITIPIISLAIYTDGGFLLDLGFPTGSFATGYDYSRSFAIQGFVGPFPVMGAVGLYLGRLSAEAEYSVPDLDPQFGAWNAVWKFGFAAKLGFGKSYKRGPLSFEFSLTGQLIFQGMSAAIDRVVPAPPDPPGYAPTRKAAPSDFLMLEASFAIVLQAMGKFEVRKAGFGLSASLNIKASLGLQFRYMTATPIRIQLSVILEAELSVSLHLVLFSITISFKFEFKFQPTFTIANSEKPDWIWWAQGYPPKSVDKGDNVLTGSASGAGFRAPFGRALAAGSLAWTAPGAIWADGTFDSVFNVPGFTDFYSVATHKVILPLYFVAPFTIDASDALVATGNLIMREVSSRTLQAGIFVWAVKTVLGSSVNGNTTLDVDDLLAVRAAIDGERQELTYATLRQFLDDNYTINVSSGQVDLASNTLKMAVFPMAPESKLTYGDTTVQLNQKTLRDNAYYQQLDAYLEALILRVERQLGLGDGGTAGTVATKPLIEHVFEAYFELLVESGAEDAIESKVPRAADPTTITDTWTLKTIVASILDYGHPLDVKPVSGLTARLMLGGHQLPDSFTASANGPSKPSGFKPLFALTGQQVPVSLVLPEPEEGEEPDPDEVIWKLTLKNGNDSELASTSVRRADYAALTALPNAVRDAIDFGDGEPVVARLKPYLEHDPSYPIDERVPVRAAQSGPFDSTVMPFSPPFLQRLDQLDDTAHVATKVTRVTFEDEFSSEIIDTTQIPGSNYDWSLIVPFTAGRVIDVLATSVADPPGTVYRKDAYAFGGTDELTRARVASLMMDLMHGSPAIAGVTVVHSTAVAGVAGLSALGSTARIIKTNLSTVSAPRGARRLAAVAPPEEKYYGDLTQADLFASLRLIWEASIVNAPGFFLEYTDANGLPADAFGGGDTANLSLIIGFSATGNVPAYANALIYNGRPTAVQRFYVEPQDSDTRIAVPIGAPGTVAFYAGRDVTDATAGMPAATAGLFNLLAYRIKDTGSHAGKWSVGSESWSLPFGPLKHDTEQLPDSVKALPWVYEVVVPWTSFLAGGRTSSPVFAQTGSRSPYDIVGGAVELELAAFDTFGNKYPDTVSQSFPMRYTDALISIAQWPETQAAYHINESGQIVVTLTFGADAFDDPATIDRARALRAQYETIWFQLSDANTTVKLHTSLLSGSGEIGLTSGTLNTALVSWVEQILSFLNAKVTGATATAPETKTLTSTAISRANRDARADNIGQLTVSVEMSRPSDKIDADATARIESIGSITSTIKANTELEPDLPELPSDMQGLSANSLVGFAQRFEKAFPELRLATGDSDTADQALWVIRMGRGVGASGAGIRYAVNSGNRTFFANAPLSTRLESTTIIDPESGSPVDYDGVDMDRLGRRFVAVVDDMLSQDKVVGLRQASEADFRRLLVAKETVAGGIPNGMLAVFTEEENDARRASARETFHQTLLKSLSAAYDVDTIVTYDVAVSNSNPGSGVAPNLYGNIVSLDPSGDGEAPFVVGTAKVGLGGDSKLSFTFSTELDSERAQLPANLAYQVTYVEHDIQTGKPAWAPPSGTYEYRSSSWLKLILPDNTRVLNNVKLPNDPLKLASDGPINVPIPLREVPTVPAVLRQSGTPEQAIGDHVTLAQAAAWEYEYQIERPRAAQDRIYLHVAFNLKPTMLAMLAAEETLLEALCLFDLQYSRLIGADKPIAEQTQPTPAELLTLIGAIEKVADKWGTWEPNVPIQEYTWRNDDWAYHMSETAIPAGDTSTVTIHLRPLAIKEPIGGKLYGNFPEIRVPDPLTNGPMDLSPSTTDPGAVATYTFDWPGVLPDNQTRSFVFSNLNVLKTENVRGRTWLTRNENLGELDGRTTNERFVYRSGATEFTDPLQPYIDRGIAINIAEALALNTTPTTLAGYLEPMFKEIFTIAIDNGYPWPLTKINCRYGHDPRNKATPVTSPDPDGQFIVHLPVLEHVPFSPNSTSGLANDIQSRIAEWEAHMGIPTSPTRGTGFYEFDLSVFSTLSNAGQGRPVMRLRRLWIKRLG